MQPDEKPPAMAFRRKGSLPGPQTSASSLDENEQVKVRSTISNKSQRGSMDATPEANWDGHEDPSLGAPASPSQYKEAKDWSLNSLFKRRGSRKASLAEDLAAEEELEARDEFHEASLSEQDPMENISPVDQEVKDRLPADEIAAQFKNFFSKRSSFDENLDWAGVPSERSDEEGPWRPPASWASQVDLPKIPTPEAARTSTPEEEFWAIRVFKPMDKMDSRISSLVDNSGHTFVTVACSLSTTAAELCRILAKKFTSSKDLERFRLFVIHGGTERLLAHEDRPVAMLKNWLEVVGYRDGDQLQKIAREDHSYLCRFVFHEFPPAPPSSEEYEGGPHPRITSRSAFLADENLSVVPVAVFRHAASLEFMDLSRNTLLEMPEDLFESLTCLRLLRLIGNQLTTVPRAIIKTQLLTHLDLSSNNLTGQTLDIFAHCPLLTHLNLACNQIERFPDELRVLTKMRALDLSSNYLSEFPQAIFSMTEMKELNLAFNLLREIPDAIENLKLLRVLAVTGNSIYYMPHGICELIHLRQLSIQGNLLEELGGIAWIASASEISMSYNGIRSMATGAWNSATQVLSSHNQLSSITFQQRLPFLRVLNLRVNKLIELPNGLFEFSPALEILNLERNLLTRLPTSINSLACLEQLQLGDNELSDLSSMDFVALGRLIQIDARGNNIKALPANIWRAPALKTLNLSSNFITSFPEPPFQLISRLPLAESLEELFLAENSLSDAALEDLYLLTRLTILNLNHNQIFDLGDDIGRLTNLTHLFVSGNSLSRIPETIEALQNLRALFVNCNKISNIPPELAKIKTIEAFDVSSNNLRFNVANWPYDWNWNYNTELQYLNIANNRKFDLMPPQQLELMPEKIRALIGFSELKKLRLLNVMNLKQSRNIPDETISLRVRKSVPGDDETPFKAAVAEYPGRDILFDKYDTTVRSFFEHSGGGEHEALLGLFDGRGSDVVSYYLKDSLPEAIAYEVQRLRPGEDISEALRRGFLTCNRDLSMPTTQMLCGASATVLYLTGDNLYVANVGDAMAILCREGKAVIATEKHHCWNRAEQSRIRNLGGSISTDGLVERELAITRGFGFHHLLPYVNVNPHISGYKLGPLDEFIIVGSQSFWKYIRYQVAVDIARAMMDAPDLAVAKLRDTALGYGAARSMTIMLLIFGSGLAATSTPDGERRTTAGPSSAEVSLIEKRRRPVRGSVEDRTLSRLDAEIPPPKPPCAIVFTDIRESTKLWEKDPNAMRAANKIHNQLLRRLLRRYRGYEVKNEGDAFMVVFETPLDALRWCMSVQQNLLEAEWPQEILNGPICAPQYASDGQTLLYRGLSVRMGVHYGMAISEQDIVTHRMDYFGVDVITASRICDAALGGQLIITSTVYRMIQEQLGKTAMAIPLGESETGGSRLTSPTILEIPKTPDVVILDVSPAAEQSNTAQEASQPPVASANNAAQPTEAAQGMVFFEIGATKLKGIENFELVYAVYPENLAERFTHR